MPLEQAKSSFREDAMRFLKLTAAIAIGVMATSARAADIKVICSNGFAAVMQELGPQYERATGHKLIVSYGLAAVLGKSIEGGEAFDLTILAPPQIDALIRQGKIAADSRAVLARSGISVMVGSGRPQPDISTVDAFQLALLDSQS